MTVKEFYVSAGSCGDWELRRKIEQAVMTEFKLRWGDTIDENACRIIADAGKEIP